MRRKRGANFMIKKFAIAFGAVSLLAPTPLPAQPRGDEPVAVPRTIKQGIDFVYVDPQLASVAKRRQRPQNWLARLFSGDSASRTSICFMQISSSTSCVQTAGADGAILPETIESRP